MELRFGYSNVQKFTFRDNLKINLCCTIPRVFLIKELFHCDFSFIMSSTFVADTTDDHKSDNTLIIIVNNDGTVSVDQETLQNLIGKCLYCNLGARILFDVANCYRFVQGTMVLACHYSNTSLCNVHCCAMKREKTTPK